jgi:tetratricopeptide (TPR) repeat protein
MEANRKLMQTPRWQSTQKAMIDTAASLQEQFLRKKGTDEASPLTPVLIAIYNELLQVSEGSSDRIRLVRIHFNLAEILFDTKDFEGATGHYRWIVDHGMANRTATVDKKHSVNDRTEGALVEEARLKAVGSRYEALSQKGYFPKDLTARNMEGVKPNELPPEVTTWVSWVRDLVQWTRDPVSSEVFFFEANRMLYAQGHIEESLKGMAKFFRTNPHSKYAIPSAALILDTYVASEKWEWAYELCEEYLKQEAWKKTEFHEKVLATAGDTSIKIIELYYKKGVYREALARAQKFLEQYPKNNHRDDALLLAANSCLAMKDKKRALTFFEPLLKSGNAKPETLALAYLTSTSVAEESYDFKKAAAEMRKYMGVSGPPNNLISTAELGKMRNKTLMLSVLSGDHKELGVSLASKAVCAKPGDVECERYRAVATLIDLHKGSNHAAAEAALDEIRKADPSNKVYFATLALEDRKHLSFEDHLRMFQLVPVDFSQLDWFLRYTVLTPLSTSLPEAVRQARRQVKQMAKLKINKGAIDKRVKLMTELENNANKLLKLPSILIQVNVLNELASMYDDFSTELRTAAVPAGVGQVEREAILKSISPITQPFELKRSELRKKAFDLASDNAVGDESFELVSNAFFTENPDVAKDLRPSWLPPKTKPIDASILEKVDPTGEWTKPGTFKFYILSAIKEKDWPRAAFFMQEVQDHKEVSEDLFDVVKAVALAGAGAQAEALVKLLEASEKMPSMPKTALLLETIPRFYRSYSKVKTKALVEKLADLKKANDLGGDSLTIAHAAKWSNAELSSGYKSDLFALIPGERTPAAEAKPEAKPDPKKEEAKK